jgi:hypothetical protein
LMAPQEIVSRYEAPFVEAGLTPGLVTVSSLAALEGIKDIGVIVVAKLTGKVLTVLVLVDGELKLVRCLELEMPSISAVAEDLYPTFAYVEDQFGVRPRKLILCGFGLLMERAKLRFAEELDVEAAPLHTALGPAGESNAGLLGYLQSVSEN